MLARRSEKSFQKLLDNSGTWCMLSYVEGTSPTTISTLKGSTMEAKNFSEVVANMPSDDASLDVAPCIVSDDAFRAMLANGEQCLVAIDDLCPNPANVRLDKSSIPSKVESYKRNGFDVTLGRIVIDENNVILRGHLRTEAAIEFRKQVSLDVFNAVFPDNKIPCIRLSGLSAGDKIDILADHGSAGDRQPLTEWETMLLISQLLRVGKITAERCGARFGKSRQWADKMIGLAKLPREIRESFKPCLSGDLTGKLRSDDIVKVVRDFRNNRREVFDSQIWPTWLDGTHRDSAAYKSAVRNEKRQGGMLDLADFRETAEIEGTPAALAEVLKKSESPESFRANVSALATETDTLRAERDALRIERDALMVERDALQAELNALRDAKPARRTRAAKV